MGDPIKSFSKADRIIEDQRRIIPGGCHGKRSGKDTGDVHILRNKIPNSSARMVNNDIRALAGTEKKLKVFWVAKVF